MSRSIYTCICGQPGSVCLLRTLQLWYYNHHFALLTMGKVFTQVNETEHRLVKIMAKEGTQWTKIQRITARSADTISNILKSKGVSQGSGAPVRFSAKDFDKVLKVIVAMVKKADAQSEVTMAMIKDLSCFQ